MKVFSFSSRPAPVLRGIIPLPCILFHPRNLPAGKAIYLLFFRKVVDSIPIAASVAAGKTIHSLPDQKCGSLRLAAFVPADINTLPLLYQESVAWIITSAALINNFPLIYQESGSI